MSKIAPPAPPMIPARHHGGAQTPALIVMHGTVSPCRKGNARSVANWWHGTSSPDTSAHYVADPGESVQCVGDHTEAYHCGYNLNSIGYELSDPETGAASRWEDADHKAMLAIAAVDVARLCLAYGIPIRRLSNAQLAAWDKGGKKPKDGGIVSHRQMSTVFKKSTHTDPIGFPMAAFVKQVKAAAADLQKGASTPVSKPKPKDPVDTLAPGEKVTSLAQINQHGSAREKAALAQFAKNQGLKVTQTGELIRRLNVLRAEGKLGDTGRAVFYAAHGWHEKALDELDARDGKKAATPGKA